MAKKNLKTKEEFDIPFCDIMPKCTHYTLQVSTDDQLLEIKNSTNTDIILNFKDIEIAVPCYSRCLISLQDITQLEDHEVMFGIKSVSRLAIQGSVRIDKYYKEDVQ